MKFETLIRKVYTLLVNPEVIGEVDGNLDKHFTHCLNMVNVSTNKQQKLKSRNQLRSTS